MINVWLLELLVLNSPWGQGGNDLSDFLGLAHLSLVYIMLTDSLSLPLPFLLSASHHLDLASCSAPGPILKPLFLLSALTLQAL